VELLISSLVGGLVGLMLGVLFEPWLTHQKENVFRHFRRWTSPPPEPIPPPHFMKVGPIETTSVIIDGDGEAEYIPTSIECTYDPTPIPLPLELEQLRDNLEREQERRRQSGEKWMWNGGIYALKRYRLGRTFDEDNLALNLHFGPSDWYTACATNLSLDSELAIGPEAGKQLTLRDKYLNNVDWSAPLIQPVSCFGNTFGINLVLISGDNQLVLTKRSPLTSVYPNHYHITMNECVQRPIDRSDYSGSPNLYRAAIRGAAEELGLELCESDVTFLVFQVDTRYSMWGILGVGHTNKTYSEMCHMRDMLAKDRWKSTNLFAVELRLETALQFMADHSPWVPGGLACLYYTLIHEFGKRAVTQTVSKQIHWSIPT
jgi:hypothetical protein